VRGRLTIRDPLAARAEESCQGGCRSECTLSL